MDCPVLQIYMEIRFGLAQQLLQENTNPKYFKYSPKNDVFPIIIPGNIVVFLTGIISKK